MSMETAYYNQTRIPIVFSSFFSLLSPQSKISLYLSLICFVDKFSFVVRNFVLNFGNRKPEVSVARIFFSHGGYQGEERSLAISASVWGLGPERSSARLLFGFLENQGNEEAKQEGRVQSKSWK